MTRVLVATGIALGAAAVGGCVAGIAASAVSMAAQSARGPKLSNEHLKPLAEQQCSARAAPYGEVHIIDIQQRGPSRITVWGTVNDGRERRSFECGFGTKITSFKLRAIAPR